LVAKQQKTITIIGYFHYVDNGLLILLRQALYLFKSGELNKLIIQLYP